MVFATGTGITDAVIVSETVGDDTVDYVFCGTYCRDGETVICEDETVYVSVSVAGANVCEFDATEYYRNKRISYDAVYDETE